MAAALCFLGLSRDTAKIFLTAFGFFFNFHLTISNNFNRLSGTRARRQKNLKQFKKRSKMIVICENCGHEQEFDCGKAALAHRLCP